MNQDCTEQTSSPSAETAPSPRAFAQGTGVLLQMLGIVIALSSGCICALSGEWDLKLDRSEIDRQMQDGQAVGIPIGALFDDPGRAGLMLTVVFSTVGGLVLAVFGLGLQSEARRAAWGATISAALLLLILVVAGAGLWIGEVSFVPLVWHAILVLLVLVLLCFSVAALKQVQANPPPPGLHDVPPGFDVRDVLAGEKPSRHRIEAIRTRLEIEQRELERLERELEKPNDGG